MKQRKSYTIPKRFLDIFVSLSAMIVLSPVFAIIALIIKLDKHTSRVIYAQERVGQYGKKFKIYKFQSMVDNADQILKQNKELYAKFVANGYKLPTKEDPRITKIGAFLRKTSLDELPQFWNTFIGTMSIIGPRPVVEAELVEYGTEVNQFLSVKPGVFGLWQASGRSNIGYPERAEIELGYVQQASLGLDFQILFKTVIAIFKRDGAF
ncbi:sugar transferase [Convivina intestini]|uniref:sugar transferase n=1 Tax=Convivina intestini TaxID=1505726 RepID=UPI00200EBBFA|nr:sugar transferase [Convivina intestini]CAH1850295.1 UDP-glucose:undecaprenyl-phosphate glucose-1-phosphate transferase [Convivina intestini]